MPKQVQLNAPLVIDDALLEMVRIAHCSYEGEDTETHRCVGSCLISPHGVSLLCSLCGSEKPLACEIQRCEHEREPGRIE